MTNQTESTETTANADLAGQNERLVMPLRMTERELDERIRNGIKQQPKYAGNSNFYLKGWDGAKVLPTVKAMVLSIGLVELVDDLAIKEIL